jgi:hypothetical protein
MPSIMLRPQLWDSLVFLHATITIEKWIVCFYRRYTVSSQAVLHAGNYIMTPQEPAQITSILATLRVHLTEHSVG